MAAKDGPALHPPGFGSVPGGRPASTRENPGTSDRTPCDGLEETPAPWEPAPQHLGDHHLSCPAHQVPAPGPRQEGCVRWGGGREAWEPPTTRAAPVGRAGSGFLGARWNRGGCGPGHKAAATLWIPRHCSLTGAFRGIQRTRPCPQGAGRRHAPGAAGQPPSLGPLTLLCA